MGNNKKPVAKKKQQAKQAKKRWPLITGIAAAAIAVVLVAVAVNGNPAGAQNSANAPQTAAASAVQAGDKPTVNTDNGEGITIVKKDVTEKASFIPYKIGNTKMEVVAVKAPDGTIRTALNTCQVCWDSGRGYYKQEGDELVCQNCGNRFKISQIEKEKNGCNPVPITSENKTDNGDTISISGDELAKYKGFFES